MSDSQKLKDAIAEYREANKKIDDKLKTVETTHQQARQAETEIRNRQY